MLGAIIGDIAGSVYESPENNIKTKDFPFFGRLARITDDTVLTCAVANAFMEYLAHPKITDLHQALIRNLKSYGNAHQHVPYGKRFREWMEDPRDTGPYGSYGNGSAMRVSSAAWLFDTLDEVEAMAKASAEVTHDHPQGIKGAQAVAAAAFLARIGKTKKEIGDYIQSRYYALDFTLAEIRPDYCTDISCDGSVPQAIAAFLEADSYEDAIRNAISIGGDSDTIAAMAGTVAEPFFGIPDGIHSAGLEILAETADLLLTFRQFETFLKKKNRM